MAPGFAYHRLVVGYHGCDRAVAEGVLLRGAPLKKSANRWDWLGEGIYFWEHGPERAMEFAEWKQKRGEIAEPFVLGAYIHLGRCFDLTDTLATEELGVYYDAFVAHVGAMGQPIPQNEPGGANDFDLVKRYLDCAVLNFGMFDEERRGQVFDTVRGVFTEGEPAYNGSKILRKTHVQVAVRNPECILGYFRPTE